MHHHATLHGRETAEQSARAGAHPSIDDVSQAGGKEEAGDSAASVERLQNGAGDISVFGIQCLLRRALELAREPFLAAAQVQRVGLQPVHHTRVCADTDGLGVVVCGVRQRQLRCGVIQVLRMQQQVCLSAASCHMPQRSASGRDRR